MALNRTLWAGTALLLAATVTSAPASAQQLQATLVQNGFSNPSFVCSPPGDLSRLFVLEQLTGRIRIIKNGATLATPFLNLGSTGLAKISTGSERGLLGLAFHPQYASNGYFYVNYTATSGATTIERYSVSGGNADLADTTSGLVLLSIAQPQSNHNGGCIQFGSDDKLYIGMGDGGGANDTGSGHATVGNAQSPDTLLGKILRIDVDLPAPYIPPDNPFVGPGSPLDEIWHLGVRNPWRFSFDRLTGDLYIGDVGQNAVEEVDFAAAGVSALNFGWRCMEGTACTGLSGCTCNAPTLTLPIKDYSQGAAHCSVVGGYVYRGSNICGLDGTYFYADYCSTSIWSFKYVNGQLTNFTDRTAELEPAGTPTISAITSFGEDAAGEIYICDYADGEIYRIDPAGGLADCNQNGIPDLCDIQNGTEADCDGNLVPDSCDIASGAVPDCNGNLVPDSCDIAAGTSLDVNMNGIPDECECAGGAPPFVYCTAKINSQFCLPTISFSGAPKLSGGPPFLITATQVLNNKNGLLFYGYQAQALAFQGGYLCVRSPIRRTPITGSGGSPSGLDCSGVLTFDFSAQMTSGFDPLIQVAGQQVNAQFWSRDPQDPYTTNTTDAVQFQICQ